ncbi:SusC/RagA family TonB-linked outer membrane protein [Pedobacter sp. AW1-32]|uniref:SusC/RagA family TonB-linked outer membrane protein n=1 Tax=Pedobacter sp. AW1-32 TaxID=3383026 RepID=UPI003FF14390
MKRKLLKCLLFFFVLLATKVSAQERTVTGLVTAKDDGIPLPGVSVKIKGEKGGVSTSAEGKYSIRVPAGQVLEFSFLGYITTTRIISETGVINVALVTDAKTLEEVTIASPYGSEQTKLTQTGSIGIVKAKDLEQSPFTSIDKALQGKVAGVMSIAGNGQPGAAQQIRIRGVSSINASNEPLYVVDGVPINSGDLARIATSTNALAGINPNDIESMTVLKDASAASIYGSRAANGVILITTKTGKAGKTKLKFDAEYGIANAAYLSDANKPLDASQYRELSAEGLVNGGYFTTLDAAYNYFDNTIVTTARQSNNTNWLDVVTQTGKQQQYNLSASGGNEKTVYSLSGGYFKQEGTVIGSEFNRITSNINLRHTYNDKLSFGINLNISNAGQSGPYSGGSFRNPVLAAYFLPSYKNAYAADGVSPNVSTADFASGVYNPVMINAYDKNKYNLFKGLGSADLAYKILPNLKFTSKIGIDYNNMEEDMYWNPDYGDGRTVGGYSYRYYTRYFNWVSTNLLNYSASFLSDKSLLLNVRGGYEAQKSSYYTSSVTTTGLPTSYEINVPSAGSVLNTASGTNADYTFASLLSIADISYKGKYVLQGSFRRDGSSRFGSTNRYGNFWSVGGTWNLDQEDFIKQYSWISQLKIRGSYGKNGNAGIGNYDWRPLYSYGYNYNSTSGSAPSSVGNVNLTWEDNRPFDLGVDMAFFKGRLAFNVDYYSRKSSNLLLSEPLPTSSGFASYSNNVGSMRNRGFEFTVSGTPIIAGDFRWDVNFNIALNKNKILSIVNGQQQIILSTYYLYTPGVAAGTWYMREWAGVDPANGNPLWYTDETKTATTSSYSAAKQVNTGKQSDPKGFGSFTNTFTYKGFSLEAMLYYSYGNWIRDSWASYTQSDGANASYNRVAAQMDRWQKAGDITNVPKYVYNNTNSSSSASTRFLYKGDYIRLRDVTLGYQVPKSVLSKLNVNSLRVYARGSNLYTWVRDKNLPYDPEAFTTSATNFTVYMPRTITFGVNVGL